MHQIELAADNKMEACEKLSSISDGLNKVLSDERAGCVPRVKNLTHKLNFVNINFSVQA